MLHRPEVFYDPPMPLLVSLHPNSMELGNVSIQGVLEYAPIRKPRPAYTSRVAGVRLIHQVARDCDTGLIEDQQKNRRPHVIANDYYS